MLIDTRLVGANFRPSDARALIPNLQIGDTVTLVREPENPHDSNAVAIMIDDTLVGYIPRVDNALIAQFMDAGGEPVATVAGFQSTFSPFINVSLPD